MHLWSDLLGIPFFREPLFIRMITVLVATLICHVIALFLLRHFSKLSSYSKSYLDDIVVYGALKPVPVALWLTSISYIARMYAKSRQIDELLTLSIELRDIGLLFSVSWFCWRVVNEFRQQILIRSVHTASEMDQTTVDALCKLGHLIIFVITVITLLQTLGVSISGLLAAGGIGGIAVGFAAKDILANFFGGLTIYMDRPFSVGDWIRSPDKDIEGTVEVINWRHTRIRRFNKNPLYVPNMLFTTISVENPSRMSHRRIKEFIGIRYDDFAKIHQIVNDVRSMLESHPDIDQTQTLIVNFVTFGPSSLDFMIYTFTRTRVWEEYHRVKHDVLLRIGDIIKLHHAEIAFPTQTIHLNHHESAHSENKGRLIHDDV